MLLANLPKWNTRPTPRRPGQRGNPDGLNLSPGRVLRAAHRQVNRSLVAFGRQPSPPNRSDQGHILFGDLLGVEEIQDSPQGQLGFGKENQARGFTVEPVGRVSCGPVGVARVSDQIEEIRGIGLSHAVDKKVSRLVRDEEPLVLGGHGPSQVGGGLLNIGHLVGKGLPLLELLESVGLVPIEEESPLGNRCFPGDPVEIREPLGQVVDKNPAMSKPGNAGRLVHGPRIEGEA